MRFRVPKNLSEKQLDNRLLEQAKIYCAAVLSDGCMSGLGLAEQRKMMQYYEAILEKEKDTGVLPGQIHMFEEGS